MPLEKLPTSLTTVALQELGLKVEKPVRVLCVDDEEENLFVMEAVLEDSCDVLTANSGQEALDLLNSEAAIDVIISDQRMPSMTGVELISTIAEHYPDTIRMMLTGYTDVEPMLEAINRGDVYRFLIKPFEAEELRSIVDDALSLKWTTTALQCVVQALAQRNSALFDTQARLAEAREQLLASERVAALGRLSSGVAHDVRNCCSIILLLVQYIQAVATDQQALQTAKAIIADSQPMLELLEGIRRLGRLATSPDRRERTTAEALGEKLSRAFEADNQLSARRLRFEHEALARSLTVDQDAVIHTLLPLCRRTALATSSKIAIAVNLFISAGKACFEVAAASGSKVKGPTEEHATTALAKETRDLQLQIARLSAEAQGGQLHKRDDIAASVEIPAEPCGD